MTGQLSISIPVRLYASLLRLEGAALAAVRSNYQSFPHTKEALQVVLNDLHHQRDGKAKK